MALNRRTLLAGIGTLCIAPTAAAVEEKGFAHLGSYRYGPGTNLRLSDNDIGRVFAAFDEDLRSVWVSLLVRGMKPTLGVSHVSGHHKLTLNAHAPMGLAVLKVVTRTRRKVRTGWEPCDDIEILLNRGGAFIMTLMPRTVTAEYLLRVMRYAREAFENYAFHDRDQPPGIFMETLPSGIAIDVRGLV